jgi:hypothetical protein
VYNSKNLFPEEYTICPRYIKLEFEGIQEPIHYCLSSCKECHTILCSIFSPDYNQIKKSKNWAKRNGFTVEYMKKCWNKAIEANNSIVINLAKNGNDWTRLNENCLKDLTEKYKT